MEHKITIQSTGRFQTTGNINKDVKAVWFVFHGYGMRSDEFIKEFDCIADSQTLIVAPEGMHRFYARGTRGKIASSWTTSDLREEDISNTMLFLNSILDELQGQGISKEVSLGVLGFSQGAPTAVRWAMQAQVKIAELVVWGSDLPKDVLTSMVALKKLNESNVKLIIGSKDEYISEEKVDELIMDLHDSGVDFDFHTFEGTHELHEDSVRYFHARIMDEKLEY